MLQLFSILIYGNSLTKILNIENYKTTRIEIKFY